MPKVAELGFHVGHRPVSKKKLKEEEISLLKRPLFLCIRWADSSKPSKTFRAVRPGMLSIMRKFWSKWNASVHEESFRSKWSTSRGGPLWPVGSVGTDLTGFGKALEKRPAGDEVEQIQFLILFAYKLMIGYSGKNRENYPIECFW